MNKLKAHTEQLNVFDKYDKGNCHDKTEKKNTGDQYWINMHHKRNSDDIRHPI